MKCYIDEEEDVIRIGNDVVLKNCIEVLGKLSEKKIIGNINYLNCPHLPPISEKDFIYMRRHLSSNKAITFDGYSE